MNTPPEPLPHGGDGEAPPPATGAVPSEGSTGSGRAMVGAGGLRAGLLRSTRTRIGGDQVEGDKIVIRVGGDRGVVLRTLAAGTVETVRHAFQAPPRRDDRDDRDDRLDSRASGHLVFLKLAGSLVTEESVGAVRRSRPALVRPVAEQPPGSELHRLLGYLWADALDGDLFADEAAGVLEAWAAQAEDDRLLLDDMVHVFVEDVASRGSRTHKAAGALLLLPGTARPLPPVAPRGGAGGRPAARTVSSTRAVRRCR